MTSPTAGRHRGLTIGICMTVVAIAFEAIAVATAMPAAAEAVDGVRYYAWAFSLFLIGMLVATVVAGRVSDRIGPSRPLLVGLVVFAAGLVVSGTAATMLQLVGGRLVQGLGSGVVNTALFVFVARAYAPAERPRMFTYISTAWVLPSFVGPPVAAWLTHHLSWHWVFFAVLPLVAVGGVMVLPALAGAGGSGGSGDQDGRGGPGRGAEASADRPPGQPPGQPAARPAARPAAGLVGAGAAAIQYAGQHLRWSALLALGAGLAALLVGLPRLMPPGFLRMRRGLSQVITVRGLLPGAFFGGEAFIPLMLVEQRHLDLLLAGAVLTVGASGWTAGSWLQSQRWLRVRRDRLVTVGCLSVGVGLALVAVSALWVTSWVGLVAVGWVFAGLGMGLATSSTSLAVITLSAPEVQGRNAASLNLFDALGSGICVGAAGTIFAALRPGGNPALTFGVLLAAMTALAALAAAVSLRIGPVRNELV